MRLAGDTVQSALVALAAGWTITHVAAKNPSMADEGILAAMDSAWPLSMLWFLVVGITVARAR
ncbi:MAG TPA: hypothetical protein VHE80_05175, partial [Acidimicrobiales bacterium]|nr:hypothetical protein [Acidimicrobiales bacterium]